MAEAVRQCLRVMAYGLPRAIRGLNFISRRQRGELYEQTRRRMHSITNLKDRMLKQLAIQQEIYD